MASVVTRFAPSPTGLLHAGNYRTAVFAYLFAKKHTGSFILRIEDTDKERSRAEYEANIMESLAWLQLPHDAFFRQSERASAHTKYITRLLNDGHAYISKEESQTEGSRSEVIRFKNPGGVVSFTDAVRGTITTDVTDLHDFVIAKSLTEPVFHLAVVADDADMGVTHVIRGEDHISNTPRQILIQQALGFKEPIYVHLPLILAEDRTKLSKRKGARALTEYRDKGYLPEAMFNYLALLGWNPGTEQEFFTKEELIDAFDLARIQKGGAIFDEVKLTSINQYWLRRLSDENLIQGARLKLSNHATLLKLLPLIRERAKTLQEAHDMLETEFDFVTQSPIVEKILLLPQKEREKTGSDREEAEALMQEHLLHVRGILLHLPEELSHEDAREHLYPYAEEKGKSAVLWPLRVALSGKERSPDPFTIISILGRDASVERINRALGILK